MTDLISTPWKNGNKPSSLSIMCPLLATDPMPLRPCRAGLKGAWGEWRSHASPVKATWPRVVYRPRIEPLSPAGARPLVAPLVQFPFLSGVVQHRLTVAMIHSSVSATDPGPPLWGTGPYIMCPPTRHRPHTDPLKERE